MTTLCILYAATAIYVAVEVWRAPIDERRDERERTLWKAIVKAEARKINDA